MDVWNEGKSEVKDNSKVFGLSNWQDGVIIDNEGEGCRCNRYWGVGKVSFSFGHTEFDTMNIDIQADMLTYQLDICLVLAREFYV